MPNDGDVVDIRGGLIAGPLRAATDPEETTEWEQVSPRHIDAADWRRFERYVAEIFAAFGMDLMEQGGILTDPELAPLAAVFQQTLMTSPASRIAGGSDEIMRNIIAERVLGLPKD